MDMNKMGAFLQVLRKEQGLTQEQLGEKLHISGKTISRWETGTYMPPVEMLLALSELYGVSMNELVAGERLTPEALPQAAEENLTASLKEQEVFQFNERKRFWLEKWQKEHRGLLPLLIAAVVLLSAAAAWNERIDLVAIINLIAIGISAMIRNRRDDYVEHHLYDDMLE